MLRDSAYIQEKDAEFFNRKIRKKGEAEIEPLYDQADAEGVMGLLPRRPLRHAVPRARAASRWSTATPATSWARRR